ncbi:MAG TPA: N-acetylmuramoyl-L-alanine amidase [Longimicrobiales bacterium]|nr:N-acetylmuramoyl-L-alanine amidase [Longimicrobiales bacterium]
MKSTPGFRHLIRPLWAALAVVAIAGCATVPAEPPAGAPGVVRDIPIPGTPEARREPALPAIPDVDGPLRLEVGYPRIDAPVAARDSNFIFGSTGSGRARLTINDIPVDVARNGGFLAFIPVPPDGVYRLRASRNGETATLDHAVRVPGPPAAPAPASSILAPYPTGAWTVVHGEHVEVGFRGPPGGQAAVVLPGGMRVPLLEQGAHVEAAAGEQFRTDVPVARAAPLLVRYAAMVPVTVPLVSRDTAVGRPRVGPETPVGAMPAGAPRDAVLELVIGADTARAPLAFTAAILPPGSGRTGVVTAPADAPHDWTTRGRNDVTGPFHYFWPAGTRLAVTGERNGMYRVSLADSRTAWVPAGDVRLLAHGAPVPRSAVNSARFAPQPGWIDLRIPLGERLPYQVTVDERALQIDVFGATSRANFFQHGPLDPFVLHTGWQQVEDGVFRVAVDLAEPVWGYHAFHDETGAIVLRIRRPPALVADAPLRGLVIGVDAGHGGADRATRGPTGFTEADANLAIALRLRDRLQAAGARVLMIRDADRSVALADRPRIAADSSVHILVSVHNNAFPDGVNPWLNNGTSTYYYHPHSAALARLMQHELLDELGLRDIGYGRADLALVRPTWMPAVLTETMFMMIPEHEAALMDPAVQDRIAAAHQRALERFLRLRSAAQAPGP